ncbi:PREDICTED: endogenous retrovirus group FC1 Env polyprotein-like [Myotis davidii]|uniref:endogenous retrovirus group FC1 Env polyprotein-like n=1 Tax=Myotis davidii TaxID=225400 RepID=UPI0007679A44|nr:PREDICTED: endogenous retrovirus group FC1 Env polyprotein-like [Myotis davidii]
MKSRSLPGCSPHPALGPPGHLPPCHVRASLQRQVTSVAQVALQNQRTSDLLDAEKGGTCIFLQEECCYYVNESGVVEQNVQTLTKLSEEPHARHSQDNSPFGWFQSPLATWVLPMIGPLILLCVFFLLAPCLLKFICSRIPEMSQVTVNQLLLHPYASSLHSAAL